MDETLQNLKMARDLIQEAKGTDGPNGGFITDHLDSAENWLDKVEDYIKTTKMTIKVNYPAR